MSHAPTKIMIPLRMHPMHKRVAKEFKMLEKQIITNKRVSWRVLNRFFYATHQEWYNHCQGLDQHTGGEESAQNWWHKYFRPKFDALETAKVAQDKRRASRRKQ